MTSVEQITIVREANGDLWIRHDSKHTYIKYDNNAIKIYYPKGRWTIVSSDAFPQTIGRPYTHARGPITQIIDLILDEATTKEEQPWKPPF